MHFLIAYIQFLATATNQHGVHSPFIYQYVTQCLYGKDAYKGTKAVKVLLKSMAYFKAGTVHLMGNIVPLEKTIATVFPSIYFNKAPFDVIYIDRLHPNMSNLKEIHNHTVMVVNHIHRTKRDAVLWNTLKNDEKVTVTVDMFHCGAVFFRKEQAKQHFKIRI